MTEGRTALRFAAQENDAASSRLLLAAGASVEAADGHGNAPLWRAVIS